MLHLAPQAVFEEYDFNHDGVISAQELELLLANLTDNPPDNPLAARSTDDDDVTHDERPVPTLLP